MSIDPKINGTLPAGAYTHDNGAGAVVIYTGLTKREYMAAQIIQGIISSPQWVENWTSKQSAEFAVEQADVLLEELARGDT